MSGAPGEGAAPSPPPAGAGPFARAVALAALSAALVLTVLAIRQASIGRDAVAAADAASARSDWPEAVAQARTAAEAISPASPWPERGLRRLEAIAHDAEARGDDATALLAYGAMRTATLETRAAGSTGDRWRRAADEGVARVAASSKAMPRARPAVVADALRGDASPSIARITALALSAAATLAALARLAFASGDPRVDRAARGVAAAGFAVYAAFAWMG
jgi:hypothetical protein